VSNLIILAQPTIRRVSDERIAEGLRLKTVAVRRPPGQVLDPQIKSINYLNLILAKLEAKAAGADEALLLNLDGRLCEATGCNLFVVNGQQMRTPGHDILAGITRETVLEIAPGAGVTAQTCDLELYDAYTADEVFLSSTAGGLMPVSVIDGRRIGTGRPGPVFRTLETAYRTLVSAEKYATPVPL
jgi:branched-chain amino acid aminotransferase